MSSKKIILAAAFFYLLIAPFFYHSDIKTIFYQSQFLSKGVINIYSYLSQNPGENILGPFVYPPLSYFIFGTLYLPVKIIAGAGFTQWLGMGNIAVDVNKIFSYIFAMKLPSILALLLSGHFLGKCVNVNKRDKVLLFWFFNPISIYTVAFIGQFDVLVVLVTILALYKAKSRPYLSSFLLGLGALLKSYPLILLPFFVLLIFSNNFKRLKALVIGLLTYILGISMFLSTPSFFDGTLVSGLSLRIFEMRTSIGFGESILIIPLVLILTLLLIDLKDSGKVNKIYAYFFFVLSLITTGSHFHPQWIIWALPFLAIGLFTNSGKIKKGLWLPVTLFFIGYFGTVFLFEDKFLTWGLISAFDQSVLFLPTIRSLFLEILDVNLIQSLFHTMIFSSSIFIGVNLIFKNEKN